MTHDRLIVFAGIGLDPRRVHALHNRRVRAIMVTFDDVVKKHGVWLRMRPVFKRWKAIRYLDSGVFTLMREASNSTNSVGLTGLGVGAVIEYRKTADLLDAYIKHLAQDRQHFWDYAIGFDTDRLSLSKGKRIVSGRVFARDAEHTLQEMFGDRMIHVWHPSVDADGEELKRLVAAYDYIAVGGIAGAGKRMGRRIKYACDYAHANGTRVHGLGVGSLNLLSLFPFDTADSASWIKGRTSGNYAGVSYRAAQGGYSSAQRDLEARVRALGYDPKIMRIKTPEDVARDTKGLRHLQWEIGAALMQEMEKQLPPIPTPYIVAPHG